MSRDFPLNINRLHDMSLVHFETLNAALSEAVEHHRPAIVLDILAALSDGAQKVHEKYRKECNDCYSVPCEAVNLPGISPTKANP